MMTVDEIAQAIDELKAGGMDDEALIGAVYMMFKEDQIDVYDMKLILNVMGYDLTDEYMNMTEEEQKDADFVDIDEDEELEEETHEDEK